MKFNILLMYFRHWNNLGFLNLSFGMIIVMIDLSIICIIFVSCSYSNNNISILQLYYMCTFGG